MNLIFRLLIQCVLKLLGWLLLIVGQFVLLPLALTVIRLLRDLISLSFTATTNGPRNVIDRLAGEWTERFHERVDNREYIHQIYQLCRFLVGTLVVLGWLVATLFTIVILRVVFGSFI